MALGICIKEYQDEEDLEAFDNGEIEVEEIKVNKVGDEAEINFEYCDKKYWKLKG